MKILKQVMAFILSVITVFACCFSSFASDTPVLLSDDDFSYEVIDSGAVVTGYNLSLLDVVIPDTIDGYPVVGVANDVFEGSNITSLTLGKNVTYLDSDAFAECSNLTQVTFNEGLQSVGEYAFSQCTSLTSVILPESVTEICDGAFMECESLKRVVLGGSECVINQYAFTFCYSLESLTVKEGVSAFGSACFAVTALNHLRIPDSASVLEPLSVGMTLDSDGNPAVVEGFKIFCSENSAAVSYAEEAGIAYEIWEKHTVTADDVQVIYDAAKLPEISVSLEKISQANPGYEEISDAVSEYAKKFTAYKLCIRTSDGEDFTPDFCEVSISSPVPDGYNPDRCTVYKIGTQVEELDCYNSNGTIKANCHCACTFAVAEKKASAVEYTISFDSAGGSEVFPISALAGAEITAPTSPEKEGYSFGGWLLDGEPYEFTVMPDSDITLTASWNVNSYKLSYCIDGEVHFSDTYEYGSVIPQIDTPAKTGYSFSGWSNLPYTMPAQDTVVTGSFIKNVYSITYYINHEYYYSENLSYEDKIIPPEEPPVATGYSFSGWENLPETMPAYSLSVYGSVYMTDYTVSYYIDGEFYYSQTYHYGDNIENVSVPIKDGYNFSGWIGLPETMPAENITVNGSYLTDKYIISYYVDGEFYTSDSFSFGDSVTPASYPAEKEGYTFSGWSEIPETMPSHNVTVNGSFKINSYTVTYYLDSQFYSSQQYNYGEAVIPVGAPEVQEGYAFSGWSGVPETMPSHNVNVTGNITLKTYSIFYYVDGEFYDSQDCLYKAEITPLAQPTKEGYTFSGWSSFPSSMPACNVEVYGTFTIKSYSIVFVGDYEGFTSVDHGNDASLPSAPEGYIYTFTLDGEIWDGKNITSDAVVSVTISQLKPAMPELVFAENASPVCGNTLRVYEAENFDGEIVKYIIGLDFYLCGITDDYCDVNLIENVIEDYEATDIGWEIVCCSNSYEAQSTGATVEIRWNGVAEDIYHIVFVGDVNGDSTISATDFNMINNIANGVTYYDYSESGYIFDSANLLACDVNRDWSVSGSDVNIVLNSMNMGLEIDQLSDWG